MTVDHPNRETLAKWLSGRLEHDDVLARIAPHLFAVCPGCRDLREEIAALQREFWHSDEWLVVSEGAAAPEILALLLRLPSDARAAKLEAEEMESWCLGQLLLLQSEKVGAADPVEAAEHARLALKISYRLSAAYDPAWIADLQARAHARLAEARRLLGERWSAKEDLERAERCLASGTGDRRVLAEVLIVKAPLLRDRQEFDQAVQLLDEVLAIYTRGASAERDAERAVRAILLKADLYADREDLSTAIDFLVQASAFVAAEAGREANLAVRLRLLDALSRAGRLAKTEGLLASTRELVDQAGTAEDRILFSWVEARVALLEVGKTGEAEAALLGVQETLLHQGRTLTALLVSIELVRLYLRDGRAADLTQLVSRMWSMVQDGDGSREWPALVGFLRACETGRATSALAVETATALRIAIRSGGREGTGRRMTALAR